MAYRVDLTARAQRDLVALFAQIKAEESEAAMKWYVGFKSASLSLSENPHRYPLAPENKRLWHLLYGNKPHSYRAIFRVLESKKVVDILHIRHGARDRFTAAEVEPQ